jgi:hypothetical protein
MSTDTHERIHAQLSHPSYTKAPAKNKNYNKDLRACDSQNHRKTPLTATVNPTLTAVVEEAMATPDLEEPHRKEALREPHKTSDAEARMKTTMEEHRPGTRPEPLRP